MTTHISFSQLRNWAKCPFYHKLSNIDKVDGAFTGNIYTAFGSALHETIENHLENTISDNELGEYFKASFLNERQTLDHEIEDKHFDQFLSQGDRLVKKYKDNWKMVGDGKRTKAVFIPFGDIIYEIAKLN